MHQVYAIQNPAGRFYIGISDNVENRVAQHNAGISRWTKTRGRLSIRWTSKPMSITDDRKLENLLKKQKGGNGFYVLTGIERTKGS